MLDLQIWKATEMCHSPLLPECSYIASSVWSEEFADFKGAITIRISKKNRQHKGQKKKQKKTNNDLQNIHIKLKIE
jgi:hypothetical protein